MDTEGKCEMLAPMCDYDDISSLNSILTVFNKLEIPKHTLSHITRVLSISSGERYINYSHTICNKK